MKQNNLFLSIELFFLKKKNIYNIKGWNKVASRVGVGAVDPDRKK